MPGRHAEGWVLLEVLVALAVLALALSGLTRAVSTAASAARVAAARGQAVMVADSMLESAGIGGRLEAGETAGTSAGHSWRLTVTKDAVVPRLFRVTATVSSGQGGRPVVLTTLKLGDGDAN